MAKYPHIYLVKTFRLKPSLWDTPKDPSWYPFVLIDGERIKAILEDAVSNTSWDSDEQRLLRMQMNELISKLRKEAYADDIFETSEDLGWFPTFEHAERFVLEMQGGWDDCGMFNLACILPWEPGYLTVYEARHDDVRWYKTVEKDGELTAEPCDCPGRAVGEVAFKPRTKL